MKIDDKIDSKIEKAEFKIDKLEKKIAKLQHFLDTTDKNEDSYMYEDKTHSLKIAKRDLKETKTKLDGYIAKKSLYNSIDSVDSIPVIDTFLENWKMKTIKWYKEDYQKLLEYKKMVSEKQREFDQWCIENNLENKYNDLTRAKEKELRIDSVSRKRDIGKFGFITLSILGRGDKWEDELDKILEQEKVNKKRTLILKIKDVVGNIVDASNLFIGSNGEINGFIKGEKGKVRVLTISAGGWNIQCFHYRVLITKMGEKE